MEHLKKFLDYFRNKKVVVWGDFILDEYIYTTTCRVSREAPVLVTELESKEYIPGGAGNVVMNLKSLGAHPIPVGFSGSDSDGAILKEILRKNSITPDYIVGLDYYKTPKKSRILSGRENTKKQQVLRIDTLNQFEIERDHYKKIEKFLVELLREIDVLVISDYLYASAKPNLLKSIKKDFPDKKIIIDSRNNLLDFKNVTLATPNEPELKKMFPGCNFRREEDFYLAGQDLLRIIAAEGIILKRGHKGMIVFEKDKTPQIVNIYGSSDIVDGTGAGDTVISVISLALSVGADLYPAAQLANIAGGFVVMKAGAYPISLKELQDELE